MMTSSLACWLGSATWRTQSTDGPASYMAYAKMNGCRRSMIVPPQHFPRACQFVQTTSGEKKKRKRWGQNGMHPFY